MFVPQDRRRTLARGAVLPKRTVGSALFADSLGFTPLTEAWREAIVTAFIAAAEGNGGKGTKHAPILQKA
jgi:hypothetical protein